LAHLTADPVAGPRLGDSARSLVRVIRTEPLMFAVPIIGSVVVSLLTVAVALGLNGAVRYLWEPALYDGHFDIPAAGAAALICMVVFAAKAGGLFARRVGGFLLRVRLRDGTQSAVLDRYVEAPVDWHRRQRPQDLVSAADSAVEAAWRPVAPLSLAVGGLVMLVLALGSLSFMDWRLVVIGLALLGGMAAVNIAVLHRVGAHADRAQELRMEVFEMTRQALDHAHDDQSAFRAKSAQLREVMIRVRGIRGVFVQVRGILPAFGTLAAVAVVMWRLPSGANAADLVSAAFLLAALPSPIAAVGSVIAELPGGARGASLVRQTIGGSTLTDSEPSTTSTAADRAEGGSHLAGAVEAGGQPPAGAYGIDTAGATAVAFTDTPDSFRMLDRISAAASYVRSGFRLRATEPTPNEEKTRTLR